MEMQNARIVSTELGLIANGMMSFFLHLEWPGGGVGFGGRCLDEWSAKHDERIGTQMGAQLIIQILKTVGVEKWEDLKGKYVRVPPVRLGATCNCIGHLLEDKWLDLNEFVDRMTTPGRTPVWHPKGDSSCT